MNIKLKQAFLLGAVLVGINQAHAAGYMVQETSSGYSQAFAGRAAIVGDITTMYVNPASMTYINETAAAVHAAVVLPHAKFKIGSGTAHRTVAGALPQGGNGGNGAVKGVLPSLYAVAKLSDRIRFGLGVAVPFGLATKYPEDWAGRYHAVKSKIQTINVNPALAFKINDQWSLGMGMSIQHTEVELSSMTRFATNTVDTKLDFKGKHTGVGFNAGLMYEPWKGTRFGLSYRSNVRHALKGNVKVSNAGALSGVSALFRDGRIRADMKTPDVANLSVSHDMNEKWTVLGDIMMTRWTVFRELKIDRPDQGISYPPDAQGWKNVFMYSLGLNYKPTEKWVFRLGAAYDQSPTQNKYRSPRLPDTNRIWATAGVDYNWSDRITTKIGYARIMAKKAKIDLHKIPPNTALVNSRIQGHFRSHVDVIGLQVNAKF